MKKIYVNIWDDFEGFEEPEGGKTFAYIEQSDGVTVPQEEYVLHQIASRLATVNTDVVFNSYYPESEFGYSRWELVMDGVNEDKIGRMVEYFGQMNLEIFINNEYHRVEVYSES